MKKTRSIDYMGAVLGLKQVFEEQSYSKASKTLKISQPALSKRVYNLEKMYEQQLIVKKNGKLSLTKIGQILYNEAVQYEKIYLQTQNKIAKLKNVAQKTKVGIDEQLYLNFIEEQENDEFEFVVFQDENKMRRSFEQRKIDSLIIKPDDISRYSYQEKTIYKVLEVLVYAARNRQEKQENTQLKELKQIIYQENYISSLLCEFLYKNQLLSQKFEYVDNFEMMYAKMMIDSSKICITTNIKQLPDKYLDLIEQVTIDTPKLELIQLKK